MATMREIVDNALKLIRELSAGDTAKAADAVDVLRVANGILAQFSAQDIHTGAGKVELSDQFPLEDRHELGFTAWLAKHIAPLYGADISQEVLSQATRGWNLIKADYMAPEPLRVDEALLTMPSQRRYGRATRYPV